MLRLLSDALQVWTLRLFPNFSLHEAHNDHSGLRRLRPVVIIFLRSSKTLLYGRTGIESAPE